MRVLWSIVRREFAAYFSTPLAVVFLVVFLGAAGALTFEIGGFLSGGQADLSVFFGFHPWLYLVLMPAIGMRVWADERRSGTIEFLMTLPIATWQAVTGKFLAAWAFAGVALALTTPVWITVNYLGSPDNGVIFASYVGSFLMGGAFLALACCLSALTTNQVTAFVVGVTAGFLMLLGSLEPVVAILEGAAPDLFVDLISSLSFAEHFDSIARGVLDLRDVLFFASFILLMLTLNVLVLEGRRARGAMSSKASPRLRPTTLAATGAALSTALFLSVNMLAAVAGFSLRIDLTERQLYTLSDSSRAVLGEIEEPITIRVYRTRQLIAAVPSLQIHDRAVTELLAKFESLAGGMLRVVDIEVSPFSSQEDEALAYQLEGLPLGQGGERGYFGMVGTNSVDSLETIPFVAPSREALLQYDLTRMVYRLAQVDEPVVGIIDGVGMFGSMAEGRRPWTILNLISANFDVRRVPANTTAIDGGIDVLLVAHPVRPSPELQLAIDQYVLNGGPALVFIDPLAENSAPSTSNPTVPQEPSSDLSALLSAWGAEMDPKVVVGDTRMAIETVGMAGTRRVVAKYLPWLRVDKAALNSADVVTAQLEVMRMSSAGAIRPAEGATATLTPLIQSSEDSMLLEQQTVMRRVDPNVLLGDFASSGKRQVLATRISGPAGTAFPGGAANTASSKLTEGDINVIVVADTDLLADSHVIGAEGRLNSSNADFVLNAIETLAGGDALAGVRGGGLSYRPFTTIEAIESRAEQSYRATERRLAGELEEIEMQLQTLQRSADAPAQDPVAAAQRQQATIADYNMRLFDLRQQLREVRAVLRAEIDALHNWLRFANILLVPGLLLVAAGVASLVRRARLVRAVTLLQRPQRTT